MLVVIIKSTDVWLNQLPGHAGHHQNDVYIHVPVKPVLAIWAPQIISEPKKFFHSEFR